ncbi:hypothetical protein M3G91_22920 [Micromonospora chalcea]|uniref:hypothetical protein n=1 Tax=Micromonospora chalcea TaxID=1874 RepID=UPI0021A89EAF|nr:hypothetical protein [Micromonospora chalcea]MCT2280472.1 hypothetical protein [Micromonospora chalcea]
MADTSVKDASALTALSDTDTHTGPAHDVINASATDVRTLARTALAEQAEAEGRDEALGLALAAKAAGGDDDGFQWIQGLDGLRPTIAERHAHRELIAVDSTATHLGGNVPYRDHQLFDNAFWANTKTAWQHRRKSGESGLLGFSPVSWRTVRNPERPDIQLDLVVLVPIEADQLRFREPARCALDIRWECDRMWMVPASVLHEVSAADGKSTARSLVDPADLSDYIIDAAHPLSTARLRAILASNVTAKPA